MKLSSILKYGIVTVGAVLLTSYLAPLISIGVEAGALVDRASTQVAAPTSTFAPPKLAVPAAVVITQLESVAELTIVKMETVGVVVVAQDNAAVELWGWNLWKPEATIVTLESHGTARAGVDTTQITVDVFDNTLTLNLPAPVLLGWEMDTKQSRFVEFNTPYEIGIVTIGAVRPETATYANDQARDEAVADACENGILSEVNVYADKVFREWFAEFGYDAITVNTQPPGECR
jgi:hypothetical protein